MNAFSHSFRLVMLATLPVSLVVSCSSVRSTSISPEAVDRFAVLSAVRATDSSAIAGETSDAQSLTSDALINEDINLDNNDASSAVADPIKPVNRFFYTVNDRLYGYVLRPVSRAYDFIMPDVIETGITNFYANLQFPVRFAGNVLQGKADGACRETKKFVLNTTAGGLGFWKVSDRTPSLHTAVEDVGQALGAWGIPHGPYLVLPIAGPASMRDVFGRAADTFLQPSSYVGSDAALAIRSVDVLNSAETQLNDYDALKTGAIDPYEALKDAYIQSRNRLTAE